MSKWNVKGWVVGSCIVWIAEKSDTSGEVGFFDADNYGRPFICVMSETKSGAIAAAQAAWRTQVTYIGQSY